MTLIYVRTSLSVCRWGGASQYIHITYLCMHLCAQIYICTNVCMHKCIWMYACMLCYVMLCYAMLCYVTLLMTTIITWAYRSSAASLLCQVMSLCINVMRCGVIRGMPVCVLYVCLLGLPMCAKRSSTSWNMLKHAEAMPKERIEHRGEQRRCGTQLDL